jgi:isopentenyl diphosphate isomerase/L-lactate dehydrogenase-like FMN-dependent dehydrogenase
VGGEAAVTQLLRGFLAEFDLTLALSGHTSFEKLGADVLRRVDKPL